MLRNGRSSPKSKDGGTFHNPNGSLGTNMEGNLSCPQNTDDRIRVEFPSASPVHVRPRRGLVSPAPPNQKNKKPVLTTRAKGALEENLFL